MEKSMKLAWRCVASTSNDLFAAFVKKEAERLQKLIKDGALTRE